MRVIATGFATFLAILVSVLLSSADVGLGAGPSQLGTSPSMQETLALALLYWFLSASGVVLGILFSKLEATADKKLKLTHLRSIFQSAEMIRGLIASVLVFGGAYAVVGSGEISIEKIMLAFQNGFFWRSVMQGLAKPTAE